MFPDSTSNKYQRSISEDPAHRPPNVLLQRAQSVPYGPAVARTRLYSRILAVLIATKAVMDEFIHTYPAVWNVDLPRGITIQLSDALRLLPGVNILVTDPLLKIGHFRLVLRMLTQMKGALPFTIDPGSVQHAMHEHGQVSDLLDRATNNVNDVLTLVKTSNMDQGAQQEVNTTAINSARTIMASAVVIAACIYNYICTVQNNHPSVVV